MAWWTHTPAKITNVDIRAQAAGGAPVPSPTNRPSAAASDQITRRPSMVR